MAKKSRGSNRPLGQDPNPSDSTERSRLSEAVAAEVEIVEARLYSSHVQFGEPQGKRELSVGHRSRVSREGGPERLRVFADFYLSDTVQKGDAPPAGEAGLHIEATFRLDYTVKQIGRFAEKHLEAFGEINGVYNAWPFWREFVYSMMARMGLPPITLPIYRVNPAPPESIE